MMKFVWIGVLTLALLFVACDRPKRGGTSDTAVNTLDTVTPPTTFTYRVPLDPASPWPKFRRNALQNGRSPVLPVDDGSAPWVFKTAKGIFSTPVIGGDGTVYVGSADQYFYAIASDGTQKWRFPTGEIIDSSALLDTHNRVIFGSGDGTVYALDRDSGTQLWQFHAELPKDTGGFINWFEGNVAIGLDGTLYIPNDNFRTYAVDPETQQTKWSFKTADQTWSLAALNPSTNRLFIGNNFLLGGENVFAIDPTTGTKLWGMKTAGSVAASPLLTGDGETDLVVVGSFDGYVRAFRQSDGMEIWKRGTRDHVYASAAQLSDGTIIQPSADGTVYALNPADGSVKWAFDTLESLRSSPAVDGNDLIYLGSGEGRLFVLNPDGTLRWAMRLIDSDRDDLNASPALGKQRIIIAGESGEVFGVPYEYCLRPAAAADARCLRGPKEDMPADGATLVYTTRFGKRLLTPPTEIEANQPLAFWLTVRNQADTQLVAIDTASLTVTLDPPSEVSVDVSGARRFLTIVPKGAYRDAAGGQLMVTIAGNYLVDLERDGIHFTGGKPGGNFAQTFTFDVRSRQATTFVLSPAKTIGEQTGGFIMSRVAAPLPTILPSYNQIGFDSISYVIGMIDGDGAQAIAFGIGGKLNAEKTAVIPDPQAKARFVLAATLDTGLLRLLNDSTFHVEFNGFPIPFSFFQLAARLQDDGQVLRSPSLNAKTICGDIQFYGVFLQKLGYCNPQTDVLNAFGGVELTPTTLTPPAGVGTIDVAVDQGSVVATFSGSSLVLAEHHISLLLVDESNGKPLSLNYTDETHVKTLANSALVGQVSIAVAPRAPMTLRAYVIVDGVPVARVGGLSVSP